MKLSDLDFSKIYSYADYYQWTFKDRVELINGWIFRKEPQVPNTIHQIYCGHIFLHLYNHLGTKNQRVYSGIFDVRLPITSIKDNDVFTVVQPDICVILDKSMIDDKEGIGKPDIIMEILSSGSNKVDLKDKFYAYEQAGVKEYWIVFPYEKAVLIYRLNDGKFIASRFMVSGDNVTSALLPGFSLDLKELFKTSTFLEERFPVL